jgi:hypothetical protein
VVANELRRLRNEVKALANWWDVLPQNMGIPGSGPPPWPEIFAEVPAHIRLSPKMFPSTIIEVLIRPMADRIDFTLKVDSYPVWQRAVFFRPPSVAELTADA